MKKLFLLTLLFVVARISNAQHCLWDSTVVHVSHVDQDFSAGDTYFYDSLLVQHFDLDSGLVYDDSFNLVGFWSRIDTVFDAFGAVSEINTYTGSLTGWYVSSRVIRDYTASGQLQNETEQKWNGVSWDTLHWRQLTYTVQGQPASDTYWSNQSGNWNKVRKVELAYANGVLSDKTTYHGASNAWVADTLFSYVYTNMTRTNLSLSTWNVDSARWDFVDTADYTMINGYWLSRIFSIDEYFVTRPDIPKSQKYRDLDTSEFAVNQYMFSADTFDLTFSYSFEARYHQFINQEWRLTYDGFEDFPELSGAEWTGSSWYHGADARYYTYDTLGNLIGENGYRGRGSHGGGPYFIRWTYNLDGSLASETYDFDGRAYNHIHNVDRYYYLSRDTVGAVLLSDTYIPLQCPVSEDSSLVHVVYGCGPFRYQWLPSQGVVNDTSLYSPFTITDTATYTLAITDANGNSTELQVLVSQAPVYYYNLGEGQFILSTLCNSIQSTLYTNYTWYYEGTIIASSTDCSIQDSLPGRYWCELTTLRGCVITTDTFVRQFQVVPLDLGLCDGGVSLLPDGSTVDSVGVYSAWSTASDTNFIATVHLIPSDTVYRTSEICMPLADTTLQITHLMNSQGCDSVVITTVIAHPESTTQVQLQFCDGDSLQLSDGRYVTQSGVYVVHLTGQFGCDSVQMALCSAQPAITVNLNLNICLPVADTSVFLTHYTTPLGCDSLVIRTIIAHPPSTDSVQVELCGGDSLLLSDGTSLSQTGVYSVPLTGQYGCDSTVVVDLTVHQPPLTSLVVQGNTLVATSQATFYYWYLNGVLISVTAQGILSVQQSGYYEVAVSDSTLCLSDRIGINFITGLDEGSESGLMAYPNPVQDYLRISFISTARHEIFIFDALSRMIWQGEAFEENAIVSFEGFESGVYFILVRTASEEKRISVIKN